MTKLIQKDITFDFDFIFYFWQAKKVIKNLRKKYDVELITYKWLWLPTKKKDGWSWQPLSIKATTRVNIQHDVDIDKIREAQYAIHGGIILPDDFSTEEE